MLEQEQYDRRNTKTNLVRTSNIQNDFKITWLIQKLKRCKVVNCKWVDFGLLQSFIREGLLPTGLFRLVGLFKGQNSNQGFTPPSFKLNKDNKDSLISFKYWNQSKILNSTSYVMSRRLKIIHLPAKAPKHGWGSLNTRKGFFMTLPLRRLWKILAELQGILYG